MASVLGFIQRNYTSYFPPNPPKAPDAIKIGILGAATIAPSALITPARSHPGVIIEGVAARDVNRAQAFAKKHGIPRVFASYQELLDDPNIDAIYNPLPNSLHYEWTIKALKAGKHVLLKKPSGNTAEETVAMFELAKARNLVLLEAFHYRFHPAIQTVRALAESGVIGKITGADAEMAIPSYFADDDIRFQYELGGGAVMDLGSYAINCVRYVLNAEPVDILKIAVNEFSDHKHVDRSLRAIFEMPDDITSSIYCDFQMPKRSLLGPTPFFRIVPRVPSLTIKVFGEEGHLYLNNFCFPTLYHSIQIRKGTKGEKDEHVETIKAYNGDKLTNKTKGEDWWTTYRYQLEAFVDKVKGRTPQTWVTAEDSIANMKVIDDLYESSGLNKRPVSPYLGNEQ